MLFFDGAQLALYNISYSLLNLLCVCVLLNMTARRYAESFQSLADYICSRYQWKQHQFDRINWRALQHAIKRKNKQRTHTTKLVHDLLPTNQRVHCHNPSAQRCPSCASCSQEDCDDIMRCSAPPRKSWQAETILELECQCQQLYTEPGLTKLLLYGISKWLEGQDAISPAEFPPKYHQVISQQNDIGWQQLFNGQMGIEWARIQDDHVYLDNSRRLETTRTGHNSASLQASFQQTGTQWWGKSLPRCGSNGPECGPYAMLSFTDTMRSLECNFKKSKTSDNNPYTKLNICWNPVHMTYYLLQSKTINSKGVGKQFTIGFLFMQTHSSKV